MIYFIGAGSGSVDYITVKGARILKEADVIVYAGSLVNVDLLKDVKPTCKLYDSKEMDLEAVLDVLTSEKGTVVRLHSGDPSLYGAIREQFTRLDELGIAYEVVPGVSCFQAAAATLKAEYTLPDVSQTLIITRMEGRTPVPELEKLERLASHGASMAIFLSINLVDKVQEALLKGAYTEETPVAVVYKASWPEERVFRMKLKDLAKVVKENDLTKTSIILVGDFLGDTFSLSKLYDKTFETMYRKAEDGSSASL
ncbi:precorrin-4 C(11)-methyltransferase [Guggenheimella bovis]